MKKVYDKCCGIDVHKKLTVACFIHGNEQEVREFGATTRELLDGKIIDKARLQEMKEQKIIAHNLRASFDQIADDLNGVMSPLQKKISNRCTHFILVRIMSWK